MHHQMITQQSLHVAELQLVRDEKKYAYRTAGTNIEAFTLHPGSIATNLGRHMGWMQTFGWLAKPFLKTPEQVQHLSVTLLANACCAMLCYLRDLHAL